MMTISVRNVNHALPLAMRYFQTGDKHIMRRSPRGMATLEWDTPVTTVYQQPMERVLFNVLRDANPFFHLFEAMWILAKRNDVAFLAYLLPRIVDFSDDGLTFHGAYGYRLGQQLERAAEHLIREPDSRRAVCSIWDPDLDQNKRSRDIPCNDMLVFRIRNERLDLTVYNRSNDVILGAYGANAVQFAFILEYVAALVGVKPGRYYQVSNSFHVYLNDQWEKLKELTPATTDDPYDPEHRFRGVKVAWTPLGDPKALIEDLALFFAHWDQKDDPASGVYQSRWARFVLVPAWNALYHYRQSKTRDNKTACMNQARWCASKVIATDWSHAMTLWLERRMVT